MSKGNIFSVEITILGKKKKRKKGQSNVSAVYFGNQNYCSIIVNNTW